MPEGDTLHRTAHHLARALVGKPLVRYWAYRPELLQPVRNGRVVTRVEARGKNLLIRFDDERVLYSHLRMTGSWHLYRPGERWQIPGHLGRVVMENDAFVAVCFSAPEIELLTVPELSRHPVLTALGPDLLGEGFDAEEALRRYRERNDRPLGEVVLDQTAAAGMGNVYKSEMLFLERLDPFLPVRSVPDDAIRRLLQETRTMMKRNLSTAIRTTRSGPGSPLWVYERAGEGCFRCRGRIGRERQGDRGRTTYFCLRCQGIRTAK